MYSTRVAVTVGLLGILGMLGSCSDEAPCSTCPKEIIAADSGVIVSDPLRTTAPALRDAGLGVLAAQAVTAAEDVDIAYVSLPPGEVEDGVTAVITSPRMTGTVTVALSNGGFDPVPLVASLGDVLEIEIRRLGGATPARFSRPVPGSRNPKVIRTVPPRGKVDVVVNADIMIVFTEPVDVSTLSSSTIRLLRGATPVAGTVRVLQGATATAVFEPAAELDPNESYQLVVTTGVRDLAGDPLSAEISTVFTTGISRAGTVYRVRVLPDTTQLLVGSRVQLSAVAQDSLGQVAFGRPITWVSENPQIATVTPEGLVTAVAEGEARIRATVENGTGYSTVRVVTSAAPVASVEVVVPHAITLVDGKLRVEAIARDSAGNTLRFRPITWSSSDPTIAVVAAATSGSAVVSGVGIGPATITASVEGRSGAASITIAPPGYPYSSIEAGGNVTCGLTSESWAMCWGMDSYGRLAGGDATYDYRPRPRPGPVVGGLSFTSISVGSEHSCALVADGTAYCWGANWLGQLGAGTIDGPELCPPDFRVPCSTWPARVAGGLRFSAISAWGGHTCAVSTDGVAYCWGSNIDGRLGVGTTVGPQECIGAACSMQPVPVAGALRFTDIGLGEQHSCALSTAATVYCWGLNDLGQLGNATLTGRTTPGAVSGGRSFVSLSVGGHHSCALTSDGTAYCWGNNFSGQLGRLTSSAWGETPAVVVTSLRFSAISAGGAHTCGIATDGETYCWGDNGSGQLGTGTASLKVTTPMRVAGGLTFGEVSAGGSHTCGLTPAGIAYCWGENTDGSLGDGTGELRNVPTRVAGQP